MRSAEPPDRAQQPIRPADLWLNTRYNATVIEVGAADGSIIVYYDDYDECVQVCCCVGVSARARAR